MRADLERLDLIQRYIDGSLSMEEQMQFELQLSESAELREELNQAKEANEMVTDYGLLKLEQEVKSYDYPKLKSGNAYKWFALAAVAGIIATFITFVKFDNQPVPEPISSSDLVIVDSANDLSELTKHDSTNIIVSSEQTVQIHESIAIDSSNNNFENAQEEVLSSVERTEKVNIKDSTVHLTQDSSINVKPFDCNNIEMGSTVNTIKTCAGQSEGSLVITNIVGGKSPYAISLDNTDFVKKTSFSDLSEGKHSYRIKDSNDCISVTRSFEIESYNCGSASSNAFAPNEGQVYTFPIDDDFNGRVIIRNENGEVVYETEIMYGSPNSWDGIYGYAEINRGVYYCTFFNQDNELQNSVEISVIK